MNYHTIRESGSKDELRHLESILDGYHRILGKDYIAYRNHCIRVILFFQALRGPAVQEKGKLAIAAAYHDLGIWTHHTFDYLQPSVDLAMEHLARTGQISWSEEIKECIEMHHKVTPLPGEDSINRQGDPRTQRNEKSKKSAGEGEKGMAETFRRADWIDVTLGIRRFGLPGALIREVKSAHPNRGFHRRLGSLTLQRIREKPWSPLPMFRL